MSSTTEHAGMLTLTLVSLILRNLGFETSCGLFQIIFSYLDPPKHYERFLLRRLCRVFRRVLKATVPSGMFTTFPHPNYPTLNGLMDRLNEMYATLPAFVWEVPTVQGTLSLGMEVRAKFVDRRGGISIKDATIQKVNEDETFDIVFDDRRTRKNVPLNDLQIPNVSANDLL